MRRFHEVKNVRAMQDIFTDKRGHTRGKAERYTSEIKKAEFKTRFFRMFLYFQIYIDVLVFNAKLIIPIMFTSFDCDLL